MSNHQPPRDQLGAARQMTHQTMQSAMKSAFPFTHILHLGIPTSSTTPAWGGRTHHITIHQKPCATQKPITTFLDDHISANIGIGTHIDGFSHCQVDNIYYNNFTHAQLFHKSGVRQLAIAENCPKFIARCKLIDMAAYYGLQTVPGGTEYTTDHVEQAMEQQGVSIDKGDIVMFHSGWMQYLNDADTFNASEPGIGVEVAKWLVQREVLMVAADTWALEVFPSGGEEYQVHVELLKKNGVYIGEMFNTQEMVGAGVNEGTLVLAVPQSVGCVQARVNPIFFAS